MITIKYISLIFCSFFIFIYILTNLRTLLTERCEDKVKVYISNFTNNYHLSFLLGIFITIMTSSSNAVTILLIAFLSANLIKTKSALAILLGTNIGTTLTVFIFSFDIGVFSFILILLGLVLKLLKKQSLSLFFIYLGLIFFTLTIINLSFDYLKNNIKFIFSNSNLITLLEGTFITAIINSSSTTIISSNMFYANSIITLEQGLSLMLGANIGTTLTTYFYTLNQTKKTKQVIFYNILFNIFGALIFLSFLDFFILILDKLEVLQFKKHTIAISHLIFNVFTAVIFYIILIPFKFED